MDLKIIGPARISYMLAAATLGIASVPTPASAQAVQGASKGPATICMSRSERSGEFPPQSIVVPASDVRMMIKKDFEVVPCSDAFVTFEDQLRWRDNICTITATSNDNVQDQLGLLLGERPAVLCGMAELALGQWNRSAASSGNAARQ